MNQSAVKRAVRQALAQWLRDRLEPDRPNLTVIDSWPAPGTIMPAETISVLTPGQVVTDFHGPEILGTFATRGGLTNVRYAYGWIEVDVLLDAWAKSDAERDELVADMESALSVAPAVSLGLPTQLRELQRRAGLVLRVPGLYDFPADYHFEGTGDAVEDDNAAHAAEWRASWRGTASLHLVTEEQVALLQRLLLEMPTGNRTVT